MWPLKCTTLSNDAERDAKGQVNVILSFKSSNKNMEKKKESRIKYEKYAKILSYHETNRISVEKAIVFQRACAIIHNTSQATQSCLSFKMCPLYRDFFYFQIWFLFSLWKNCCISFLDILAAFYFIIDVFIFIFYFFCLFFNFISWFLLSFPTSLLVIWLLFYFSFFLFSKRIISLFSFSLPFLHW